MNVAAHTCGVDTEDIDALTGIIDAALPQTQCTRCGYADCRSYAQAIACQGAAIDRCPPGGAQGVARLASITGRCVVPLDPLCGREGPLRVARVDEAWCIGCTLCIKACPVDCIVGAPQRMHSVAEDLCTGCELCLPACPVDCIALVDVTPGRTGWAAWSATQAQQARERYATHCARLAREGEASRGAGPVNAGRPAGEPGAASKPIDKSAIVQAALARAQARRNA